MRRRPHGAGQRSKRSLVWPALPAQLRFGTRPASAVGQGAGDTAGPWGWTACPPPPRCTLVQLPSAQEGPVPGLGPQAVEMGAEVVPLVLLGQGGGSEAEGGRRWPGEEEIGRCQASCPPGEEDGW